MEVSIKKPEQHQRLGVMYNALCDIGAKFEQANLEEFIDSAALIMDTKHGAIVFTHDIFNPTIWWVHLYSPDSFIPTTAYKAIIKTCRALGCTEIKACATNPRIEPLLERLGFTCYTECEKEGTPRYYSRRLYETVN